MGDVKHHDFMIYSQYKVRYSKLLIPTVCSFSSKSTEDCFGNEYVKRNWRMRDFACY
jgi:hypothetical protein